jgi:prepilin-type N-terminal cleavage/methylation domain-containing protein/prepilin-type processing-associated H-X9-DG protein
MKLNSRQHKLSVKNPKAGGLCAFTLIELLVVIAIISILAALLLPVLSKAKSYAHSATCKNHLHQMGLALQMYVNEHNKYPYLRSLPEPGDNDPVDVANDRWWWAKLAPYYPVKWKDQAYHCPGYKGAIAGIVSNHSPLGSYAYNARGVCPPFDGWEDPSRGIHIRFPNVNLGLGPTLHVTIPGTRPATSEPQISAPSEMFAIGESRFLSAQVNGISGGYCDMTCGLLDWSSSRSPNEFAFNPTRHGKNYNQLFCDGHVGAMSPWVLFNPTNTASMWNYDHQPHPECWPPF